MSAHRMAVNPLNGQLWPAERFAIDSSTPNPLMSNGLPFIFEKFRLDSRVASLDALNKLENTGGPVQLQTGFSGGDQANVMPLDLDLMTYPTR